ncbi:MAG: transposase, partial [Bacteroidales bacterium]|nr:transposase [Bacteroidales bacterium]
MTFAIGSALPQSKRMKSAFCQQTLSVTKQPGLQAVYESHKVREILSPYDNAIALLKDIPGLNTGIIEDLVAETGLDMSVFSNEKHLCSWIDIAPGNHQAKAAIVEAAWAATRTKNTFYSARYHRLAARRGKKRALIAVGHSILKSVYHILSTS